MLHFLVSVTGAILLLCLASGMLGGYAAARGLLEVRGPARTGILLGILCAATLAGLEFTTGLVVREYYNLAVLAVVTVSELLLIGILAARRSLQPEKAASSPLGTLFFIQFASWGAFYLPDIFIFPSQFAVGVVQVASSEFVFIVAGYCIGLALCLFTGYALLRVCSAVAPGVILPLVSATLAAQCAGQLVTVAQILLGRGIAPRYDWALDLVIFLLNNASFVLYTMLCLGGASALVLWRWSRNAGIEGENPAVRRKARSRIKRDARWSAASLCALVLCLLVMTVGEYYNNRKIELDPPVEMSAVNGEILLPLSLVGDGRLHRFVYKTRQGVNVRYIVVKKNETAYGVGLDACDVCGPSGYYERKGQVICMLCDVVMNKATIGFAGGCNPVPLKFVVKDGSLLIKTSDLEAQALRFK